MLQSVQNILNPNAAAHPGPADILRAVLAYDPVHKVRNRPSAIFSVITPIHIIYSSQIILIKAVISAFQTNFFEIQNILHFLRQYPYLNQPFRNHRNFKTITMLNFPSKNRAGKILALLLLFFHSSSYLG